MSKTNDRVKALGDLDTKEALGVAESPAITDPYGPPGLSKPTDRVEPKAGDNTERLSPTYPPNRPGDLQHHTGEAHPSSPGQVERTNANQGGAEPEPDKAPAVRGPVPDPADSSGVVYTWTTRPRFTVAPGRRPGMFFLRSHDTDGSIEESTMVTADELRGLRYEIDQFIPF